MKDSPTSVYRYYDRHGVLIYAGITSRGTSRNFEHGSHAEWWPYVARQEVDHLPTRLAALALEKALIREYRPPFNKQHNPGYGATKAAYLAFAAAEPNNESFSDQYQRLGKQVPLSLLDSDGITARYIASPGHLTVTETVTFVAGRTVFANNRPVGRIASVDLRGSFLVVAMRLTRREQVADSADLALRVVTLKKPIVTKVHAVHMRAAQQRDAA